MWELIIELEENEDVYFCYTFKSIREVTIFINTNEEYNSDKCIYTVTKIGGER